MDLVLGMRVYYTGDMANQDGEGLIVAVNPPTKFSGVTFDIDMDDGRQWHGITAHNFAPSPGRRFWPLDEWLEERRLKIAEFQK